MVVNIVAKSLLDFRGKWNETEPNKASLNKIAKTIKTIKPGTVIRLGSMTDCFQSLEKIHKTTYETIKLLNWYKVHYLIVTKSDLVANPEYLEIYNKELAHFQISITSTDSKKSQSIENAPLPNKRILAAEKLQNLGFDISVRLSPYIEGFINFNTINSIKCNKILIEFLKVNHWVRKWLNIDYSKYTLSFGGYYHLQLEEKKRIVKLITGFNEVSVGEYVFEHHEYFKQNVNFNKSDCCNLTLRKRDNFVQQTLF